MSKSKGKTGEESQSGFWHPVQSEMNSREKPKIEYRSQLWHPAGERFDQSSWRSVLEKAAAAAEAAAIKLSSGSLPSRELTERFLAADEQFLKKLVESGDERPRRELAQVLQKHLDKLAGMNFGNDGNRLWAALIRETLLATGLRVLCIGPDCTPKRVPAMLQYKPTLDRNKEVRNVFVTGHFDSQGSKVRLHGGRKNVPELSVVSFAPDLSFWRQQLLEEKLGQRRRTSPTKGRANE